jgi:ribonuclease E
MTFTEAANEVLRREGKPLHFRKITEIAVRENLLDHVGKIPEEVMADQLAAHCRLPRPERQLLPVAAGTFALVEWQLDEDPSGLENLLEPPPLDELPYRGRERHPIPAREMARVSGRGGDKARRREEGDERRSRRFPPPAEVAYEILASAGGAMSLGEIASQGSERQLMPDAFGRDHAALASALHEDNRRREAAGRRPLFQIDGESVSLASQPEPGERIASVPAGARPTTPGDLRRAGLAALRRRLRECDPATVEHLTLKLLERLGYREVKVARRGKEHVLITGRKRLGLTEIRHGFRVLRSGADASRRDVSEARRDLGHYGAQIGAVVTAGEAQRDARADAAAAGQLPVMLLCGEALAEAFVEASLGCSQVVVPVVDDAAFAAAAEAAAREEITRRGRRDEREHREGDREGRRERREPRAEEEGRPPLRGEAEATPEGGAGPASEVATATEEEGTGPRPATEAPADQAGEADTGSDDDELEEGDEEGEEPVETGAGEAAPSGATADGRLAGEARRRRRRRRRRGGRGRGERREGAPGAPGEAPAGQAPASGDGGGDAASAPAAAATAGGGSDPAAGGA